MSLTSRNQESYLVLYREVKSDDKLERDVIDEEEEVNSIMELLENVRGNVEDYHDLADLDVNSYFENWITTILANSGSIEGEIEDDIENKLEYLAEDFSESMLSRARERGKYIVLIVSEGSLIACHSFTGKKALTTDMDVIEELLSATNIDKFAEFEYDEDGEVIVHHFDKHDTQSFTDWLGIPEDEIAFDVKGDVRVYTQIDEIDVVFEFDQDAITAKLLGSDKYDLSNGMLETPNEKPRRIKRIRWGYDSYSDVEDFKQDLFKVSHNLSRAFELYDDEISDTLDSFFDVVDYQDKIVKDKGETVEEISKPQVDFELIFVNKQVSMNNAWRKDLANNLFTDHEPIPICHAGAEFSETSFELGNFRIYNEMELTQSQKEYTSDLLQTAGDMGTANLRPLFTHIVFELLSRSTPKPLRYLFKEFSSEFQSRFLSEIREGSRVIQTEGEEIGLEWKSPPWFERNTDVERLAEEINREFQSSRLLLLGVNEDSKDFDVIESGVTSEKLTEIEAKLENKFGITETHVWSLPIGDGHAIIALNLESVRKFDGDMTVLDTTGGSPEERESDD